MTKPANARDAAADLLLQEEKRKTWIREGLPAARNALADARDRALVTELAYGVVRRRGTLDAVLAPQSRRPLKSLAAPLRVALRLGLYQMLFLDRIPVHAAVDHAVTWARSRAGAKHAGYANAVLRASARSIEGLARGGEDPRRDVPRDGGSAMRLGRPTFSDPKEAEAANLAERYSMPTWLVERWIEARGATRAKAILQVGIGRPPLTLRARGDREALAKLLEAEELDIRRLPIPTALLVDRGPEARALRAVQSGDAWVQDMTAQRVVPLLQPAAGERILDLCAAPGGKTLHIADSLGGRGEIVATDVEASRLKTLEAVGKQMPEGVLLGLLRVEREGALPLEKASFDAILIDAPCTNTGVLRRRVEARWRLRPEDITALAALQRGLLDRALPLLKPTGRLVYSTCSLEPEENAALIQAFVADHEGLVVVDEMDVAPSHDGDGGYAARLERDT